MVEQADVADATGQRPDVVERDAQRDDAVARNLAGGRFEADDAACGGWDADRAAGVGSKRAEAMPAASAAADPPLDPPADRDSSSGLRTAPNADSSLVVPNANSCRLVFPMIIAPALAQRSHHGRVVRRFGDGTAEPDVVGCRRRR